MISNKTNLNYGLYFFKTISLVVCIISHFIVLSHPPLHPHNSVHFKFCFLQWQQSMQSVFQLHLMRSLHCRLEALQLMFYNLVLFFFFNYFTSPFVNVNFLRPCFALREPYAAKHEQKIIQRNIQNI